MKRYKLVECEDGPLNEKMIEVAAVVLRADGYEITAQTFRDALASATDDKGANPPFPKYPGETLQSMAEIGEAFMDAMPEGYSWCQSPAEIITDLQSELDDKGAWVAVKDRLPTEHGVYECTLETLKGGAIVTEEWFEGSFRTEYITAWRPRPAPFAKEAS